VPLAQSRRVGEQSDLVGRARPPRDRLSGHELARLLLAQRDVHVTVLVTEPERPTTRHDPSAKPPRAADARATLRAVSGLAIVLLVVGAVCEFIGIVAIGFPDFLPHGRRLSRWLRRRTRVVVNKLRRVLGLPPLQTVVYGQAALEASAALSGYAIKGVSPAATIDEKVEFLLRRDEEAHRAMNALNDRVDALEKALPLQLDRLREEMEAHVASTLTTAQEEYRALRVLGTVALAFGLLCTTVANLV
jgi:hypothetical protein